jgi:hypothetical protein
VAYVTGYKSEIIRWNRANAPLGIWQSVPCGCFLYVR